MTAIRSALLTATAHLSKLASGFVLLKIIAAFLGPSGLGQLGHFLSLVAIVSMIAGGGVTNGVIKYTAEYKSIPKRLVRFISSAAKYSLGFSVILLTLGVLFASQLSGLVFGSADLWWIIMILCLSQVVLSFINLVLGVANGLRQTATYAKIQIIGNIIGLPPAYIMVSQGGISGASLAVLTMYVSYGVPAFLAYKSSSFYRRLPFSHDSTTDYRRLFRFTAMLATSVLAFPIAEILVREHLIRSSGYSASGIWQASIRLSSAYIGFFTVFLAYYFMPLISAERQKAIVRIYVFRYLGIVMVIFSAAGTALYAWRDFFIPLLLSDDFIELNQYLAFQIVGDFFRISAYVIGFVGVAKAAGWLYISAEVLQGVLFVFSSLLLATILHPVAATFAGYLVTYIVYFLVALATFLWWVRQSWLRQG